jgi:hypothetical protein
MGSIIEFPQRHCRVGPVGKIVDQYDTELKEHVRGYLHEVHDRAGGAVVDRLVIRLMVAMCYQLESEFGREHIVDELLDELEGLQED